MQIELTGRRALVIGGGTYGEGNGIGRAISCSFAACGAHVIVADRSSDAADATVALIVAQGGTAEAVVLDVTDFAEAFAATSKLTAGGPIDILHYNVGIGFAADTSSLDPEQFTAVLDANVVGMHNIIRAVLPEMRQQRRGTILATSSAWAHRHLGYNHSFYAASKAGMEHFIRLIAQENASYGIRANSIAPGFIDTPRVRHTLARSYGENSFDEALARRAAQVPLGRLGQPEDVAHMAAFLASDLASYITGGHFLVDGGLTGASIAG
ncbi:SDR family oxidoreductase [Alcaligenaceae bacterium]|nr:SDR family oxidoreductase [Alcaligenaceae bacterium]